MLPLLKNVRDFIENDMFNVPSDVNRRAILGALDAAIIESEKQLQVSDTAKARRKEIMRLMREDFDPTPERWDGRYWNDNAEDVADRIEALFADRLAAANALIEDWKK